MCKYLIHWYFVFLSSLNTATSITLELTLFRKSSGGGSTCHDVRKPSLLYRILHCRQPGVPYYHLLHPFAVHSGSSRSKENANTIQVDLETSWPPLIHFCSTRCPGRRYSPQTPIHMNFRRAFLTHTENVLIIQSVEKNSTHHQNKPIHMGWQHTRCHAVCQANTYIYIYLHNNADLTRTNIFLHVQTTTAVEWITT